jgi:release factor glutamine methyltransferase
MSETLTIRLLLQAAQQQLSLFESARLDAELLLASVINRDRHYLYSHPEQPVSHAQATDFNLLLSKRATGYPLAYLIGHKEFWSMVLTVNSATLIPRPETELLVEAALELTDINTKLELLDLGTGSGAIAMAIASERPAAAVTATDISAEALATASANACAHKLDNIRFIRSDWFSDLGQGRYDVILSNPPYVQSNDPGLLAGEIRHEPRLALDGGSTGLDAYHRIIPGAVRHLSARGWLVLEHGYNQAQVIRDLLKQAHYQNIQTRSDYAGHERITFARLPH